MNDFDIAEWISQNGEYFVGELEYDFAEGKWYVIGADGETRGKASRPDVGIRIMRVIRKSSDEVPSDVAKKAEYLGTGVVAYRVIAALTNILKEEKRPREKIWPGL